MARTIWRNGTTFEGLPTDASQSLDKLAQDMEEMMSQANSFKNSSGLLHTALYHWESNRCDLTQSMNAISSQDILETVFSFQTDNVQIFINLEGACGEDVEVKVLAEEGGFDVSVRHREAACLKRTRQYAHRQVHRSYRFLRPLLWEKAEYLIRHDGILHVLVPGPSLGWQPLSFQPLGCEPSSPNPACYSAPLS